MAAKHPCKETLSGLIQHSFAMRVPAEMHPLYAREGVSDIRSLVEMIFESDGFKLGEGGMTRRSKDAKSEGAWKHSLLVSAERTNIVPLRLPFKEELCETLPAPLGWACSESATQKPSTPFPNREAWEAFAFGGTDLPRGSDRNDFLIEPREPVDLGRRDTSQFICQLLAHRRSQLFGLPLTRSTFNVLPPHATLTHKGGRPSGTWLAQPVITLFHVYARRRFRPIFSFSLFLIPCKKQGSELQARQMSVEEIHEAVKSQWPLATAFGGPSNRPTFRVEGPLPAYLSTTAEPALAALGQKVTGERLGAELTLRKFTETTLFSLATSMTGGPNASLDRTSQQTLGDRIVTSLSASRVSSVAVVGPDRQQASQREETESPTPQEREEAGLETTLESLGKSIAHPLKSEKKALNTYRLDKFLFDRPGYVSAVLPDDRCVITIGSPRVQTGLDTSVLLEAGWTAYMVIGAATATGLIRSVFREIAVSDRAKPELIADIEREAIVDLHETYDIEVTVEAYREHYCVLREHLGITKEYEALSDKLEALHRETSTRFEGRSEQRLTLLTWAIVILSAFILVGTLVLIFKPGG
jgi:hypothetical protein